MLLRIDAKRSTCHKYLGLTCHVVWQTIEIQVGRETDQDTPNISYNIFYWICPNWRCDVWRKSDLLRNHALCIVTKFLLNIFFRRKLFYLSTFSCLEPGLPLEKRPNLANLKIVWQKKDLSILTFFETKVTNLVFSIFLYLEILSITDYDLAGCGTFTCQGS